MVIYQGVAIEFEQFIDQSVQPHLYFVRILDANLLFLAFETALGSLETITLASKFLNANKVEIGLFIENRLLSQFLYIKASYT